VRVPFPFNWISLPWLTPLRSVGEKTFPSSNGWTATFTNRNLLGISPDDVESYLRKRMRQRTLIKTALGYREGRPLKTRYRSSGAEGS